VRENLSWSELNGPLPLLDIIQLQRLESPVISLSRMKQKALQGRELEVPCDSERAASAFRCYPAPAARMVGGFASSCEAKSASTSEAPSSSHSERAASAFKLA